MHGLEIDEIRFEADEKNNGALLHLRGWPNDVMIRASLKSEHDEFERDRLMLLKLADEATKMARYLEQRQRDLSLPCEGCPNSLTCNVAERCLGVPLEAAGRLP
jgi:hypothetical protein